MSAPAVAAPVTIEITATINAVYDSYVNCGLVAGQAMTGTFIYVTDEVNADPGTITTPSGVDGHEFSSFYEFSSSPYGMALSIPDLGGSFSNTTPVGVVVNDNLALTADETGGLLAGGIFDWIEILGSTTLSLCLQTDGNCLDNEYLPASGEEWTLALFADTGWFSDGSVVPDNQPASFAPAAATPMTLNPGKCAALLVGFEFDEPATRSVPCLRP